MILKLFTRTEELRHKFITKLKKLPVHWSSKVPFLYKRNAITDELHRAKRIALDFDKETKIIRSKYTDAGYPKHVIENSFKNFNRER